MEYRTKITAASAVLGLLALTAVLGFVFSGQQVVERQSQAPLFTHYSAAEVTGLDISGGIKLTKGTDWSLEYQGHPYPISKDRILDYLSTLASQKRERLVSSNPDLKAYGLDTGFKTLKILGKQGTLFEIQVGKINDLGDKVYVRFAGDKKVWETDRSFARTLDLSFNTWADLSLFPGRKSTDLTRIAFEGRVVTQDKSVYGPFDLVRSDTAGKVSWENRLGKASTDGMTRWANQVAAFKFNDFASPTDPPRSSIVLGTVTLTWADGTSSQVVIGPPDSQHRFRCTDGTLDFWINDWMISQLLYK